MWHPFNSQSEYYLALNLPCPLVVLSLMSLAFLMLPPTSHLSPHSSLMHCPCNCPHRPFLAPQALSVFMLIYPSPFVLINSQGFLCPHSLPHPPPLPSLTPVATSARFTPRHSAPPTPLPIPSCTSQSSFSSKVVSALIHYVKALSAKLLKYTSPVLSAFMHSPSYVCPHSLPSPLCTDALSSPLSPHALLQLLLSCTSPILSALMHFPSTLFPHALPQLFLPSSTSPALSPLMHSRSPLWPHALTQPLFLHSLPQPSLPSCNPPASLLPFTSKPSLP